MRYTQHRVTRMAGLRAGLLLVASLLCSPQGAAGQAAGLEQVRNATPFEVVLTRGEPGIATLQFRNPGAAPVEIDKVLFGFAGVDKDDASIPRPKVVYPTGPAIGQNQLVTIGVLFPAFRGARKYTGELYVTPKDPPQQAVLLASFSIRVEEAKGALLPRRIGGWIATALAAIVLLVPFGVRLRDKRNFFQTPGTGAYSVSRFQVWLWTAVIIFSYAFLFFTAGPNVEIPDSVLALMGISVGSITVATSIAVGRSRTDVARPADDNATPNLSWLASMLSEDGEPSPMRLQMFVWTIAVVVFFVWRVFATGSLWDVPTSVLALMGISHGGYLVDKSSQKGMAPPLDTEPSTRARGRRPRHEP
jgi:hypothetical protein